MIPPPWKKYDKQKEWISKVYAVMRTFGYTIQEMRIMPFPTFKILCREIDRENREYNKRSVKK